MPTEFEFIRNLKKKYGLKSIGDDCAILPKNSRTDLVVTADMLVEDVDFRLDWTSPELLGHKALAVSLSDVAAMGGRPKWALLSLAIPAAIWSGKFVDRFYEGWFRLAGQHRVELVGGDVSRSPDKLVIDSVVAGEVATGRAINRSGARLGDSIYLTGSVGGAATGLELLESGARLEGSRGKTRELILRQLAPTPRVEIGRHLSSHRIATSMIDVSDGLSADLHHLCIASGVGARIDISQIPVDTNLKFPSDRTLSLALTGGEDFELLFTSSRKKISTPGSGVVTRIGEVTSNVGIVEVVIDGEVEYLEPRGYTHF